MGSERRPAPRTPIVVVAGAIDPHDLDPAPEIVAGSLPAYATPLHAAWEPVWSLATEPSAILGPGALAAIGAVTYEIAGCPAPLLEGPEACPSGGQLLALDQRLGQAHMLDRVDPGRCLALPHPRIVEADVDSVRKPAAGASAWARAKATVRARGQSPGTSAMCRSGERPIRLTRYGYPSNRGGRIAPRDLGARSRRGRLERGIPLVSIQCADRGTVPA